MHDRNALVADCIVISCCCQCLILQVIIFILLKLPYRMIRRTKRYVKNLRSRMSKGTKRLQVKTHRGELNIRHYSSGRWRDEGGGSHRVHQVDGLFPFSGCCMDEVERVLEEFSLKGEFAFGSFWGGDALMLQCQSVIFTCHTKQEVY
ncbi:unnamed protein product [Cuscuta epithymum]|uniref:Uncharacterized protein n=1 Tax=Cuscuta epithymum TaxID=186058 RepID=A0AAV0ENJ7_9ASTE|nr:unnamed protein product [Cuscuta epithymum]